jgi:hypothetical protein
VIKICSKCNNEYKANSTYFYKCSKVKSGLTSQCKKCCKDYKDKYKKKLQESVLYIEHKTCTGCNEKMGRSCFHMDSKAKDGLSYKCKSCVYEYQQQNKEGLKSYRVARKQIRNQRRNIRRKYDINYRLLENYRSRTYKALKGFDKSKRTQDLIGCSIEHLKSHIEKQFEEWMTWDNYGEWHIDHIKPCASFDLSKQDQQKICFNFKNLRPLEAMENIRKGSREISCQV